MARFVILEKIGGKHRVYLEYNEQEFIRRLTARTLENLAVIGDYKRDEYNKDEVAKALIQAFGQLAKEFKERTVIIA